MRKLSILLMIIAAVCSAAEGGEIQAAVTSWAQANSVSSVSVAIVSPAGELAVIGASSGSDVPEPDALYEVGSLTKTMVAATALLMDSDGVLDLDAPIAEWLPGFPRADVITIRLLLSHTAGLSDGSGEGTDLADLAGFLEPALPGELLAAAGGQVSDGPVPADHLYANSGYWVVGAVIEAASGRQLAAVIRERVIEPVGMTDTYLAWSEELPREMEPGEVAGPDDGVFSVGASGLPGVLSRAWAAGGVVSTADDMAVFYSSLRGGLLSEASQEELITTPQGSQYGLGIEQRRWSGGQTGWGHNGAIPGYTASAGFDDWTVVVLTNRFAVTPTGVAPNTEAFVGELMQLVSAP